MIINPSAAYYIKLGSGGSYEHQCIERDGTLWVGFNDVPHELCVAGEWEQVKALVQRLYNWPSNTAALKANQLRTFCEADETVLWITFYRHKLWWCFGRLGVTILPDKSKVRQTVDGWHDRDIHGRPLEVSRLSGGLVSLQGYRGTLCSVKQFDYLVRKINAERLPLEQAALDARDSLEGTLAQIIRRLTWQDFELLTDLIFRQAGWQRISRLGKTQKTLDLDLYSPIANERYLVQVKSRADQQQFEQFQSQTAGMEVYTRFYFVVHTPAEGLDLRLETEAHKLWLPEQIGRLVMRYGLIDWVIDHAS